MLQLRLLLIALVLGGIWLIIMRWNQLNDIVEQQQQIISVKTATEKELNRKIEAYTILQNEYLNRIDEAKHENDILRNRVDSGTVKLRPKAHCPSLPQTTDTARANERAPELDSDARQDYFNLRAGIIELESALEMCVKLLRQ